MAKPFTDYFYNSELAKYPIKSSSGKKDEWINIITFKLDIYQLTGMPLEVFLNRDSLW